MAGGRIWEEPAPGGYADRSVLGLSHLERSRAARQGRLPISPMTYLTEMAFEDVSAGTAALRNGDRSARPEGELPAYLPGRPADLAGQEIPGGSEEERG